MTNLKIHDGNLFIMYDDKEPDVAINIGDIFIVRKYGKHRGKDVII